MRSLRFSSTSSSTCLIVLLQIFSLFLSSNTTPTTFNREQFDSLLQLPQSGSTRTRLRSRRVLFVDDFGAKGDGVTDDSKRNPRFSKMTELNAKHHTLIQALLSRGPLKEAQFHRMFSDLTGENPGVRRKAFDDYLLRINKALSYVQFELRACRNQYDGQVYYGVVNNVSDEESKLGTTYSVAQIAFYKAIIEAIVQEAAQGTISSSDALNLRLENQVNIGSSSQSQSQVSIPTALKNFSMSQKEKTLDEFVRDKWLSFTAEGHVGLGVRSFLDLRSWFRNNDVPSCEVCNEAGVKAVLCEKEGCKVRIHQYCLGKLFGKKKGETVCPSCGTHWQYTRPKAEAVEDDEPDCATQSQPPAGPRRKKPRTSQIGDGDIVESSSSQASIPGRNLRRSTRNSIRPL